MNLAPSDINKWSTHWAYESKDALKSAEELFSSRRYHHALFFVHLAVEKQIKAVFLLKQRVFPPPVHDVLYLIKKSRIPIQRDMLKDLTEINSFNIRARYEDYKREFYKKATREYCRKWLERAKAIIAFFSTYE